MRKRWQLFADEWTKTWNATEAYATAYPKCTRETAGRNGHKLLKNAEILAYINDHLMKPEEVIGRLNEQARADYHEFIDARGVVDIAAMKEAGKAHLIKGISYTKAGDMIVQFHDAQTALLNVGKYHKLFTDKTEIDIGDRLAAKLDAYAKAAEKIYARPGSSGENSTDRA